MKTTWIKLIALVLLFSSSLSRAQSARDQANGLGLIVGDPTGLSLQLNANTEHPLDFGLAYGFDHWFQIWGDYTFHYPHFVSSVVNEPSTIDAYFGIGGAFMILDSKHFHDSVGVMARMPFGLEYKLADAPLGFMLELVPALLIVPGIDFNFQGGIGVRYYF